MRSAWRITVAVLSLAAAGQAASIKAVGVLGNSGRGGEGLVRAKIVDPDDCPTGVAIDGDGAVYVSGGDRINRVALDGRLIEQFPLAPPGSTVHSRKFAVVNETLYFLGRTPKGAEALFALPFGSGGRARLVGVALPARKQRHFGYCLAAEPLKGKFVLAVEPKEAKEDRIAVYFIDPKAWTAEKAFTVAGSYPSGVAVDASRGAIYLGGRFGGFVGGTTHQDVYAVTALRADGSRLPGDFPVTCTKTPATPTQFRGAVSLAGGAMWESAWYGFLARLNLSAAPDPGRVIEWHHELNYPTQVLGLPVARPGGRRRDPLLIATPMPDALYYAVWDRGEGRLRLIRRIGCLPIVASLGLSRDGWVTASTARAQLWWRWGDPPDAPPRKAELHVAVTPGVFSGERFFALAAQYQLSRLPRDGARATIFQPRTGNRNEAQRVSEAVPVAKPVGLSIRPTGGKGNTDLLVTDADKRQLWRASFSMAAFKPAGESWQPARIEGEGLTAPTDVAALTDGRLLLADAGAIILLAPSGKAYRRVWRFDRWGDGPDEHFGRQIRFAADGACLLVSDTERHRLVYLDWARRKVLAQFGQTDTPGDDGVHVNAPGLVCLRGTRAAVADTGNQRILKLELHP